MINGKSKKNQICDNIINLLFCGVDEMFYFTYVKCIVIFQNKMFLLNLLNCLFFIIFFFIEILSLILI